jgi:CDP-glycerol glycerophosphotransferase (TagB/SpsB family)
VDQLFLISIFNILNKIIFKKNKRVSITSFPDFDDQTRGILTHLEYHEVVILISGGRTKKPAWVGDRVLIIRKKSIRGIWILLTSSQIFFTHGIFLGFKKIPCSRQKIINMWHGMPLKNVGLLDNKTQVPDSHCVYSTSPFFQKIMSEVFGKKLNEVLVSGLPRNDILTKKVVNLVLIQLKKEYDNIYVWLPTYRKSIIGDVREDGGSTSVYCFNDFDVNKLNEILKKKNSLVIIKPHPMAVVDKVKDEYSNIMLINEDWLFENEMTLYELLGASDMLWTDFSSVFVDYLLTQNPILFLTPDLESYKKKRGLTFDFSEIDLPGEIITAENVLFNLIEFGHPMCKKYNYKYFNSAPFFKF